MSDNNSFYTAREIADQVYEIKDAAMTMMFLVVGEEKAAVLDTGLGLGNLHEFVRTLTDKPLIVLLTHGHVDHAMGTGTFEGDGEVYMDMADASIYGEHSDLTIRQGYYKQMKLMTGLKGMFRHVEETDWYPPMDVEKIHGMNPGDTFDIGGETIEIVEGKGHTQGSVTMLLQQHRILLLGDAINGGTFLFDDYSAPVSQLAETLQTIRTKTEGRFDRVLSSHGMTSEANVDLIEGGIYICQAILDGKDRRIPTKRMGKDCYLAKKFMRKDDIGDHSTANIIYSEYTLK